MTKERMLTVLVPIKDSDATEVLILPAVDPDNINVIYKIDGVYKRIWLNPSTNRYEYHTVVDREFPYVGSPLEIFDFTYDATRMGTAPTISAQGVMWFAEKDSNGDDVILENMWSQECHVSFNGENFYLKQIPTSSKSNEDARYKYDLDFVSGRVVLERVYMYDVVQPFISEKPISESSVFSFFGPVTELILRINASLLSSGVSSLVRKYVDYPLLPGEQISIGAVRYVTYAEWTWIGKDFDTAKTYIFARGSIVDETEAAHFWEIYYDLNGDYTSYLQQYIWENVDGEYTIKGYKVVLGKDEKGQNVTSEEKLISFENNTIHEGLQKIKDDYGLQYFVYNETDTNGNFTGNTIIEIGDCQHDFADMNEAGTDFVRDNDGLPTTANPFAYGVDNELLSIEKANTTEKIVTSITGHGSEENIPWYYPNPTADGWIKPLYMRNGEAIDVAIDYPTSEGSLPSEENTRYEKYLKNRLTEGFVYGKQIATVGLFDYIESAQGYTSGIAGDKAYICYKFDLAADAEVDVEVSFADLFDAYPGSLSAKLYKDNVEISSVPSFITSGGWGSLTSGSYELVYIIQFSNGGPSLVPTELYYYRERTNHFNLSETYSFVTMVAIVTAILGMPMFAFTLGNIGILDFALEMLDGGFTSNYPAFFSTRGDLKFKYDRDLSKAGYYIGDNKINWNGPYIMMPSKNMTYIAFEGGDGSKTIGVDPCTRVKFGNDILGEIYDPTYPGQLYSDLSSFNDSLQFLTDLILGQGESAPKVQSVEKNATISFNVLFERYPDCLLSIKAYQCDGWYKGTVRQDLSDYGIGTMTYNGETVTPELYDKIEFQRVKYITPQQYLMPDVYIKTDGERRYYEAKDYPFTGKADAAVGEYKVGSSVENDLYKNDLNNYYEFENQNIKSRPHEHIEDFEDVKPSIKEQTITVNGTTLRIDIVEEFGYDELDSDEVWEDNNSGGTAGEYKHPHFFAKLRPLGFNLFDLALETDMVLSITTGNCGSCNFKIKVDENTKKNPVQIWPYDVYGGSTYATKGDLIYAAGSLRRYVDTSNLYYDTNGEESGYILVNNMSHALQGFLSGQTLNRYNKITYTAKQVINGFVGSLKKDSKTHLEGDVVTSGRFIDSQQDTTDNYVWVALEKDTDTYGVLMPAARPNYADTNFNVYIEPKGVHYTNRNNGESSTLTEEQADKFVLTNIRMPQVYLRKAETNLSKELVKYMYENNYQKFNFSIKFSRIYLAQNENVESLLNENSVLYVKYNRNHIYRQYVSHYTYKVSREEALPEITVEMNEELSVVRTMVERNRVQMETYNRRIVDRMTQQMRDAVGSVERRMVSKSDDVILSGNVVSRDASASFSSLRDASSSNESGLSVTTINLNSLTDNINTFNSAVANNMTQMRKTIETRLLPVAKNVQENQSCSGVSKYHFEPAIVSQNTESRFWLDSEGGEQTYSTVTEACPTTQGIVDVTWDNVNPY